MKTEIQNPLDIAPAPPEPRPEIKTASDLKYWHEQKVPGSHFFTRETMKFFGDTMKNYRLTGSVALPSGGGSLRTVYTLHRRKPVKHGLQSPKFFDAVTLELAHGIKD